MGRGEIMLGYSYQDIQEFGGALNWALHYIPESNTASNRVIILLSSFGVLCITWVSILPEISIQ